MFDAVAQKFKQSAQPAATFDFDAAVAEFYAAYPEQKNATIFLEIMPRGHRFLFGGGRPHPMLSSIVESDNFKNMKKDFIDSRTAGSCYRLVSWAANVIFFSQDKKRKPLHFRRTREWQGADFDMMSDAYAFDHESAHAYFYYEPENRLRPEHMADVFASIRHIQRFGSNTGFIEDLIGYLSLLMFTDRDDRGRHFTSAALETVLNESSSKNYAALTPEETAREAQRLMVRTKHPHITEFMDLGYIEGEPFEAVEKFVGRLMVETNPTAFKWGAKAVSVLLDDTFRLEGQTAPFPHDEKWDGIRAALAKRQAEMTPVAAKPNAIPLSVR